MIESGEAALFACVKHFGVDAATEGDDEVEQMAAPAQARAIQHQKQLIGRRAEINRYGDILIARRVITRDGFVTKRAIRADVLELGLAELKREQAVFAETARQMDSTKKPIDVFKDIPSATTPFLLA